MNNNKSQQITKLLQKAISRINSNNPGEAEEILKEALDQDPENSEVLYNLAAVHLKQKHFDEGSRLLEKILSADLQSVDIIQTRILLSYAYLMMEKYESCGSLLISIIQSTPGNLTALSLLGYYYEKIENFSKAIETCENILSFDKDNVNAHNSYAYLCAREGKDLNRALSSARLCIRKDPENPAYCDTLGYVYMKLGHTDIAKKFLKKALEKMPDSEEIREHLHQLLKI